MMMMMILQKSADKFVFFSFLLKIVVHNAIRSVFLLF